MQWETLNHIILPLFISTATPIEKERDTIMSFAHSQVLAYCKDMPMAKSRDYSYPCRLQIEADCLGSENEKACNLLAKLKDDEREAREKQIAAREKKKETTYWCVVAPPVVIPEKEPIKYKRMPGSSDDFLDYQPKSENIGHRPEGKEKPEVLEKLRKLKELHRKISDSPIPRVCQRDFDCKVIGVGVKRCGGSMDFLYYSVAQGEPAVIQDILQFNTLDKELNTDLGGFGTCEIYGRKESVCMENKCTAGAK